jgi:acyl-CoA thioesterase FadM
MYPFLRMALAARRARRLPPIGPLDWHVETVRCLPWDLDPWVELNNGRTLTLFDLGRIPLAIRTGLAASLSERRWGITVAGVSVRYRKRVRMFDRLELRTRMIGWDGRFLYMEQSMWRDGECTSHMLLRSAVTSHEGIVAPAEVAAALDAPPDSPSLPAWVEAWIAAEGQRPWPPER